MMTLAVGIEFHLTMPPAFWTVLVISLPIVLLSSRSGSVVSCFATAVMVPLVLTSIAWTINVFMAIDGVTLRWFLVGLFLVFFPVAVLCSVAVGLLLLVTNRFGDSDVNI